MARRRPQQCRQSSWEECGPLNKTISRDAGGLSYGPRLKTKAQLIDLSKYRSSANQRRGSPYSPCRTAVCWFPQLSPVSWCSLSRFYSLVNTRRRLMRKLCGNGPMGELGSGGRWGKRGYVEWSLAMTPGIRLKWNARLIDHEGSCSNTNRWEIRA